MARPEWLIASLAATTAIVVYRIVGTLTETGFRLLRAVPNGTVQAIRAWEYEVGLVIGLLMAVLFAGLQQHWLMRKSVRFNRSMLAVLLILAVFPLRIQITDDPVSVGSAPVSPASTAAVSPAKLACKVIDDETVQNDLVLDNSHIVNAEVVRDPRTGTTYQIRLSLTPEGGEVVKRMTYQNVGKRIGYWIDGDLKCSAKIMEPLMNGYIMIPITLSHSEAEELAMRIMTKN